VQENKENLQKNNSDLGIIRILLMQIATTFFLMVTFWLFDNKIAAYSSFLGGMLSIVPNIFLAARLIASLRSAKAVLRAAYIGEAGKVILTFLLFGLVFIIVKPLDAKALFISFIIVQFVISIELLRGK
jgi:ATP synthase protein I|tara:strand:- start:558 stop:944 length:387 start_codon:yes stop_codon:yes gene_type:complete